jgi:hypothetical protein
MNKTAIILSAITAFLIGMGGSLTAVIVEAKGNLPSSASWLVIVFGALAVAAKDIRSLMKLPPVTDKGDTTTFLKPDVKDDYDPNKGNKP